MGQYCFARWRLLSSSVVCNTACWLVRRLARGWLGGRHSTAGQYGDTFCYIYICRVITRFEYIVLL